MKKNLIITILSLIAFVAVGVSIVQFNEIDNLKCDYEQLSNEYQFTENYRAKQVKALQARNDNQAKQLRNK